MNLRQVIRCRCHQVTIEDDLRQVIRCRCHQTTIEADDPFRLNFNNNVFIRHLILPLPALTNLI